MDSLFIEFRDPLFGIIVILFLIFFISFLTYTFGQFQDKKERKSYKKLLKRFELQELRGDDLKKLTQNNQAMPFDTILLLASTYIQKGNYEKAISIYLTMLENTNHSNKKEELLEHLGMAYFRGGFLQRSKDVFLKILEFSPRNHTALYQLLYVYEKMGSYQLALEVIKSIDELDMKLNNVKETKVYLQTLQIIHDSLKSYELRADELLGMLEENRQANRLIAQFIFNYQKEVFWKNIDKFDIDEIIDLFWYIPKQMIDFEVVNSNPKLQEIYRAKGYIDDNIEDIDISSDDFELAVLIELQKSDKLKADISFEYLCNNCKQSFPMSFDRCPNCHAILSSKLQKSLMKVHNENNNSLL
jgi:lipopolysaccharide biosynthesis regulator YciM